jgi:hypothetical protein
VARIGEKRNACRLLVGKRERTSPLGRPKRTWVDEIGKGCVDRACQVKGSLKLRDFLNAVKKLRVS